MTPDETELAALLADLQDTHFSQSGTDHLGIRNVELCFVLPPVACFMTSRRIYDKRSLHVAVSIPCNHSHFSSETGDSYR